MTTFYLVRHAEKDGPPGFLSAEQPGFGLTEAGRRQAERVAEALAAEPIRRVVSSPLERARLTAAATAERLGLAVELSDAIGDLDYGAWTGHTAESLQDDAAWRRFHDFRSGHRIPGGELLLEVQARFVSEMLRLRDESPHSGLALFSHADPIKLAVAHFAGVPLDVFTRLEIDPASLCVVTLDDREPRIGCVNRRLA